MVKSLVKSNTIVNAILFQGLWFAAVLGSAKQLMWPALLICALLLAWQLHPIRRHPSDFKLLGVAIVLGLILDTLWLYLDLLRFTDPRPFSGMSPIWVVAMWAGFALTINHSISWLRLHPFLPAVAGAISGPLSYFAGQRFGAVEFLAGSWIVAACLAVGWAVSLLILVRVSRLEAPIE